MILPSREVMPLVRAALARGQSVRMTVSGSSMLPFVRDGDAVEMDPISAPLQVGDIVLAEPRAGHYVMHRIVEIEGNSIWLRGDAQGHHEGPVSRDQVLGWAITASQNHRARSLNRGWRRLAGRVWVGSHPIGPWMVRAAVLGRRVGRWGLRRLRKRLSVALGPQVCRQEVGMGLVEGNAREDAAPRGGAALATCEGPSRFGGKTGQAQEVEGLLLDLLSPATRALAAGQLESLAEADWSDLLQVARAHGVGPLLYYRLQELDLLSATPAAFRESLWHVYLANAGRNVQLYHQLGQIVHWLSEAGIPVVVLKGAYLAEAVYANCALRVMGDLDLLVPEADASRAYALLQAHGYQPMLAANDSADLWHETMQHLMPLAKPGLAKVELHWNLTKPHQVYSIPIAEVWQRAVPVRLGQVEALGLGPEDLLLHLCVHISYQHLFEFGLRPFCDIAWLTERWGARLDWAQVCRQATCWGWERGVCLALRVTQELFGVELPAEVWEGLQTGEDMGSVVHAACEQVLRSPTAVQTVTRNMARLGEARSLGDKARALCRSIFQPPGIMARMYPVKPGSALVYWYYLVRIKDVLRRHLRTAWRLQRGDADLRASAEGKARLAAWLEGDIGIR